MALARGSCSAFCSAGRQNILGGHGGLGAYHRHPGAAPPPKLPRTRRRV